MAASERFRTAPKVPDASIHKHLRCQTVTSRAIGDKGLFSEVSKAGNAAMTPAEWNRPARRNPEYRRWELEWQRIYYRKNRKRFGMQRSVDRGRTLLDNIKENFYETDLGGRSKRIRVFPIVGAALRTTCLCCCAV